MSAPGRSVSPFGGVSPGALAPRFGAMVGGRYVSPQQIAAIRARNAALPPSPNQQTAQPISGPEAARLNAAGRGSGVIDPTRTATDPSVVNGLRNEFSGPGVAGYHALSFLLGKNLAAHVPGTQPPVGFHPTALKTVGDALALLPTFRVGRAGLRAAQALRAGGGLDAAEAAARASWRVPFSGLSPIARETGRQPHLLEGEATTQIVNLLRRSVTKGVRASGPLAVQGSMRVQHWEDPNLDQQSPGFVRFENGLLERARRMSGNRR